MGTTFGGALKHAWDAFTGKSSAPRSFGEYGASYGLRPYTNRSTGVSSKTIVNSIYTRIAIDVANVRLEHVINDADGNYKETRKSGLNNCLTVEANIDQAAQAFRHDMVYTLLEKGTIAIVPVDTTLDPNVSGAFDILTLRVGEIVAWFPKHVRVSLYNDKKGRREEVTVEKRFVAIVENPFYTTMNETNSTLQRLIRKLALLDNVDEQQSSGKLDIIIQLPYVIKSDARRQQAEARRADIETQLTGSKYGVAYTDGTERITQLNRPVENQLPVQIKDLTDKLYSELGLTPSVFDGTADDAAMVNYFNRTVKPLLRAFTEAMTRSFLTKTARSQGHAVAFFRDPLSTLSVSDLAEAADKLTRNEIVSTNEIRSAIGLRPSKDPEADKLRNKNIPAEQQPGGSNEATTQEGELQNGSP